MEVLIILVPLSLLFLGLAVWLMFRMINDGQLDESDGAAWRILMDDDSTNETAWKDKT